MRIDDVESRQEPRIPIYRPNKFVEKKLKNGKRSIQRYIEEKNKII
jgi:hypothetical protein